MPNSSIVFTQQSAYTSFELYYAIIGLFAIFVLASLFLDGQTKPFEKLFAAIIAFMLSIINAYASFSLAIVKIGDAGFIQQIDPAILSQQQSIVPMIIMQNISMWQVVCWILAILCFINIINCILILMDYSRITGVKKGGL
jgi:uncharacterized membrane protein